MKFSSFMSNKAAAAIKPTVAGRKPKKAASTYLLCRNLANAYEINKTSRKEGKQTEKVVKQEPKILTGME